MENQDIKHLQLYLYLIPVVGFFPALWTLYQRQGSREQQAVSRQALTLAIAWLAGYILLAAGAETTEFPLRLLFLNSLLTSGYFLVSVWLMVRLSQRKGLRLPGIGHFADRVVKRHLS
jgi:uncharacterized membrane protein YhdT